MSLVGPRPRSVFDLPPRVQAPVRVPPLPYDCPFCTATLRSQVDYLLHNHYTKFDQRGDRRTRVRL